VDVESIGGKQDAIVQKQDKRCNCCARQQCSLQGAVRGWELAIKLLGSGAD